MNSPYQAPPPIDSRPSWISRNWLWAIPIGCAIPVLGCGGFVAVIVVSVFGMIKSVPSYSESLVTVQRDVNAIENMGEPIEAGWAVTGNVHISGSSGNADFAYPVSGPKGSGWVYVVSEKANGKWTTESVILESNGERFTLISNEKLEAETVEPKAVEAEADEVGELIE